MTKNLPLHRSPLLPDRHPIQDFFICDVTDAIPKDDLGSMEHPIFSLSTKPDVSIREYEHKDVKITIAPSSLGLATIHDKDILIYCISQLVSKMNTGVLLNKTLHLKAYDLLVSTNRNTDGRGYEQLEAALDRLSGTRIKTNIKTNETEITSGFGLIDSWNILKHTDSGRMAELQVTLSNWVFNAVAGGEILTLHRDYFRLRKPLERRMYELARKHCGRQNKWSINLDLLQKKCGSSSKSYEFRRLVSSIVEEDQSYGHFPDYALTFEDDNISFINRNSIKPLAAAQEVHDFPKLTSETYHDARTVAPGYDIYFLEQEWLSFWVESGKPELKDPDSAFIGFCRRRHAKDPKGTNDMIA